MEFNLHGHNRTTIKPGVVGTAINGTIRLLSDFEVRYSILFNFYNHHFNIFDSWLAIHAQRAPGNPSHVSYHSFRISMINLTDGFPVDHELMINSFAAAFFKMGLIGQANNKNVSDR